MNLLLRTVNTSASSILEILKGQSAYQLGNNPILSNTSQNSNDVLAEIEEATTLGIGRKKFLPFNDLPIRKQYGNI